MRRIAIPASSLPTVNWALVGDLDMAVGLKIERVVATLERRNAVKMKMYQKLDSYNMSYIYINMYKVLIKYGSVCNSQRLTKKGKNGMKY